MANTTFPIINHINDVLPAIDGVREFNVGDGSRFFDVVDYHIMDSHTFKHEDPAIAAIRRECRGLLFHKDGRIARRGSINSSISEKQKKPFPRISIFRPDMICLKNSTVR